jgi:hypothetical protein
VLRPFAFIMTVGIIVGTYSTIYIAGPFAMLWESLFGPGGKWSRNKKPVAGAGAASRPEPTNVEPTAPGELPARRRTARRRA